MKLAGRIAMVTGTSPNIGGGIAEALAAEGARIACVDHDARNAEDCAAGIRKLGGEALAVTADITNEAAVAALAARIASELGPVDVLVNNAAIFNQKGVLDMPLGEWSAQLAVILDGAFLCTQAVARQMVARGQGGVDRERDLHCRPPGPAAATSATAPRSRVCSTSPARSRWSSRRTASA